MNTQPQPQQQQPVVVYPNTVSGQPAPTAAHSHSNGSFGTVFIVLAVIIVVSGIACCLGRLCNKRKAGQGSNKHSKPAASSKQSQQNPNFRPKERGEMRGREREGGADLEFGFDKGFPTGRPAGNGDGRVHNKPNMPENGHAKGGGGGESFVIDGGHLKQGP